MLSCGDGRVQFCPEGGRSLNYPKTTLPLSCFVPETLWASVGRPSQSLSFLRVVASSFQVRVAILKGRAVQYLVRMQLSSKSQHQKASAAHAVHPNNIEISILTPRARSQDCMISAGGTHLHRAIASHIP